MSDIQPRSDADLVAEEDLQPLDDSAADVQGGSPGSHGRKAPRGARGGKGKDGCDGSESTTRAGVLQQAGSAALAQANQSSQTALGLLK